MREKIVNGSAGGLFGSRTGNNYFGVLREDTEQLTTRVTTAAAYEDANHQKAENRQETANNILIP